MGKKSREKRERRLARMETAPSVDIPKLQSRMGGQSNSFQKHLDATRELLYQYDRQDVAIALGVSELWLANSGSFIKHIFAWGVLLNLPHNAQTGKKITSYSDFRSFAEALYKTWPDFPMLEDFLPEADWGQIKIRLGDAFVPMFYGSCIERTPDFVKAFRITYAHIPEAQAHMDLALALQAEIIRSMPELGEAHIEDPKLTHVEVPNEEFWINCRSSLLQIGNSISNWRELADEALETRFGAFKAPLTESAFHDGVMEGTALPFLAVANENTWLPMSVRSAPAVVIDYWASQGLSGISAHVHQQLSHFLAERFEGVLVGPLTLFIGDRACEDLSVSCVISAGSGVYLICTCDQASAEQLSNAAKNMYVRVRFGGPVQLRRTDGCAFALSNEDPTKSISDDLKVIIVVTQTSTTPGFIDEPERPSRLIPMADFVTIFDSLSGLEELEKFWKFVDQHRSSFNFFLAGLADLYASFKDSHGVIVEGAITPGAIALDVHWGTSWRFRELANFWTMAPTMFPDDSEGWWLNRGTEGVVELQSRHHRAVAYSTSVGSTNVQALVEDFQHLQFEDAQLIDLFAQLLADCTSRCRKLMLDLPLFRQVRVLYICGSDPSKISCTERSPQPLDEFKRVVTSAEEDPARKGVFNLQINTPAVLAGLSGAKDGSFEVRCLLEALVRCHEATGLELPHNFEGRLSGKVIERPRYHVKISNRKTDSPQFTEPVIPSATEYKLARKQVATQIMTLGLSPGRYELSEAKSRIDAASAALRAYIEKRTASLNKHQLIKAFIEQYDSLLVTERMKLQRAQQSLSHDVDYDRLELVGEAMQELRSGARAYRYLLEKSVSSAIYGNLNVTNDILRELVALVDWYMVLTEASDILHNGIDVGGVLIDDWYIPEVFYSDGSSDRSIEYARQYAKSRLGIGTIDDDTVEGAVEELLSSEKLRSAFISDLGFDLKNMLTALAVLSQAQRYGFGEEISLSYTAPPNIIAKGLTESIEMLSHGEAEKIVAFLTLCEKGIRRLPRRDVDEHDVPYWEHRKRQHRYTIRPLVVDGADLRWGAEAVSRSMHIWMSAVRDGYLPADFEWPHIKPVIRQIKVAIEQQLEHRTEEIFCRHTPFVKRGIDFFRTFRKEGFEDVGDFDVFAYWPDANLLVTVECKYNQPPYTMKDGRRLRDQIFGKAENDRAGQFSRILRRRQFLDANRSRMIELLKWPKPKVTTPRNVDLYVSRDIYYWMVHPPYSVSTQFVRVDALDHWITTELIK